MQQNEPLPGVLARALRATSIAIVALGASVGFALRDARAMLPEHGYAELGFERSEQLELLSASWHGWARGLEIAPRIGLAALAFLLAAAWPLRPALLDPDRVLLGVDTASTALPWSAVVAADPAAEAASRPRNPGLSDQALVFYPGQKWVSRSWRAGDPPFWNPLIYAGVPAAGNPQLGVFYPQVLLVALAEALFGERGFH